MMWIKDKWTRFKRWFIGLFVVGVALAAGTQLPQPIPENLQLKTDKTDVIHSKEITVFDLEENGLEKLNTAKQAVKYVYKKEKLTTDIPTLNIPKGRNAVKELPEKRTQVSRTFLLDNGEMLTEISAIDEYFLDEGEWWKIEYATTTPDVFSKEMGFVWGVKNALATVFQPDSAGYDARINDANTGVNYGDGANLVAGDVSTPDSCAYRPIMKFDVSSIDSGDTVTNATLELYEYNETANSTGNVYLYRLLKNWVESEATWAIYSTGNNWSSGGADDPGNDYDTDVSAQVATNATDDDEFKAFDGDTLDDDVQKFVNGTYSNYGWLIWATENEYFSTNGIRFVGYQGSDTATAAQRPKLTVTHSAPAAGGYTAPQEVIGSQFQ